MSQSKFRGAIPALVTPFRDGAVDADAFRKLIESQIEGGVSGVVPVGTTGETSTLTDAEKLRLVEVAKKVANGRAKIGRASCRERVSTIV